MKRKGQRKGVGFTLIELLISVSLMALVMGGAWSIFIVFNRMWNAGGAQLRAALKTDRAVNFILFGGPGKSWTGVRDLSITGTTLTVTSGGWVLNAGTNQLSYSSSTKRITDAQGIPITDDLVLCTASITNGGFKATISVVEQSASYKSTNAFTLYVRMRN